MHKKDLAIGLIAGLGIGAGLMYIFDPDRGRRRRALARDQAIHLLKEASDEVEKASAQFGHKAKGKIREISHVFKNGDVFKDVLIARVRSKIGRIASYPHAVEVDAKNGVVTLTGSIPKPELCTLLKAVSTVHGVKQVVNKLKLKDETTKVEAKALAQSAK